MKLPWAASAAPPSPTLKLYTPASVFGATLKFSVSNGIVVVPLLATGGAEFGGVLLPTSLSDMVKPELFASPAKLKGEVPALPFDALNGAINIGGMVIVKKPTPEYAPVEGVDIRMLTDSTLRIELAPLIVSVSWSPTVEPGVVVTLTPLMEIVCPNA